MSTDHQRYSTENQAEVIRKYADSHGFDIVRTYADSGKSGLSLGGRDALQKLLSDVQSGKADFSAILVYDVSRWGRFQDADESAFHEYICKRAGVALHFCAEQFDNDGGLAATMIKGMKRVMAGEYSRELSVKVFMGQCRLIELGFRQGGPAGYGLRRQLRDEQGNDKGQLGRGEHKSIQTDRVVLIPGPDDELVIVRRIYALFLHDHRTETAIAALLNQEGIRTDRDRAWTRSVVKGILTNEKYAGDNVFNRRSFKLKQRRVANPPSIWVRAEDAFEAVVPRPVFEATRSVFDMRARQLSDEEMLSLLAALLREHGGLSAVIIDEASGVPSSATYRKRFGTLSRAYRLVGASARDDEYVEINRSLRAMHPGIVDRTVKDIGRVGGSAVPCGRDGRLVVNGELTIGIVIARCQSTDAPGLRWTVRLDPGTRPDITVVVRMERGNVVVRDYYLLPRIDSSETNIRLVEENGLFLDAFRFDTLDYLLEMTARVPVRSAA
jgi:DNA invertase Pin-like site-specific DNA recombinase